MTLYIDFIGIDIGKFTFVVSIYGQKNTDEYENSAKGIAAFIEERNHILSNSLCVVETTGGYEMLLASTLVSQGYSLHRANTRKVKNFIRSFGNTAKTDALDARALAKYGKERHNQLDLFVPNSQEHTHLFQLVQRRNDLKQALVAEKNRLKSPSTSLVKDSIASMISVLSEQVQLLTDQINQIIDNNPELKQRKKILKSIPGIGDIVAFELMAMLPEIGQLSRREIASLAGVAPRANDSGKFSGYRRTASGRKGVKPVLFIAAMAARNSNSELRKFYEKLINNGKKKMVALTALMRKILCIANARLKCHDF